MLRAAGRLGPFLGVLLLGTSFLWASEPPVKDEEAEWSGPSYPEFPDKPWFALPCYVNWAFEDARGRVWLGSETSRWPQRTDELLIQRAKATMEAAFTQDRPLLAGAEILHQDATGRFWIVIRGKFSHVLGFDGKTWVEFPMAVGSSNWDYAVEQIYEDAQGRVWLNGKDAVCRFEKGRFETLKRPAELPEEEHGGYFSHSAFVASPDGLVMLSSWKAESKTWFYKDGKVFPVDIPPGKPDTDGGWQARWPVDGNAVFHTGFMSHRSRVSVAEMVLAGDPLPQEVLQLLTAMDSERFEMRDEATRKLREMAWKRPDGRAFIYGLRQRPHSTEVEGRLASILQTYEDPQMSRKIASGPWFGGGALSGAAPRAGGVVLCWLNVNTPTDDGAGEKEETGTYWVRPDGSRIRVPIHEKAGSNLKVRFDGRGAPLVSEWRYGAFCFRNGAFVRVTPIETDPIMHQLFAVDAQGRAFFKSYHDGVVVCTPRASPATGWKHWPQVSSVVPAGGGQVWVDFESSAVARMVDGEWVAVQTGQGELNAGQVVQVGADGMVLFKGNIRADPEQWWLLGAARPDNRIAPVAATLAELASKHRQELLKQFDHVQYGSLDPEYNKPSLVGDSAGNLWALEIPPEQGRVVTVVTEKGAEPLMERLRKEFPEFDNAEQLIRLPDREGVVLLHDTWAPGKKAIAPLWLRWKDGELDARPLFPWRDEYKDLRFHSVFLASDHVLYLGYGGDPGTIRMSKDQVEFLPNERPPVLEHPAGTLWFQDLTRESCPSSPGLKALVVRRGARSWRVPLRSTMPHSMPVVDRKGLVWIALGGGVTGMRASDQGVQVVHEISWDLPGRTVYDLMVDDQNRLWCHDRAASEALCLDLNELTEKNP